MTIDDLLAVKGVSDPQVSPDGTLGRLRRLRARPRDRQDEQRPLAGPGRRRRAEAADDRAGDRQPPALEPRRQDDRLRLEPRRLVAGLAPADRRRRGPAADQAADRRLRPDLVAEGGQDRLHRRGLSRQDPRGDRREGQGEGRRPRARSAIYDQLMIRHWNAWDEGKRSHLFVADAADRRGEGPDPQARGQHPPCPVRRLVRLRLVARRQGARLHRRAGQGRGLVDQHRHLDRPGRRRRAEEPDRGQQGGRRPAGLLARRQVPRLRQPGPRRVRGGPVGPEGPRPRDRRVDRRRADERLDRPVQSFAWGARDRHEPSRAIIDDLVAVLDDAGSCAIRGLGFLDRRRRPRRPSTSVRRRSPGGVNAAAQVVPEDGDDWSSLARRRDAPAEVYHGRRPDGSGLTQLTHHNAPCSPSSTCPGRGVHLQGGRRRRGPRLAAPAAGLRPEEEIPGRLPDPRRPARGLARRVAQPLELPDVRRARATPSSRSTRGARPATARSSPTRSARTGPAGSTRTS